MAYGFIPVGGIDGRPYNGALMRCASLAASTDDIYVGDMVRLGTTSDASGVPEIIKCAAGQVILGAVVAVEPYQGNGDRTYILGSVTPQVQYCMVAVATNGMLFKCSPNAAAAITSVGLACDIAVSAGVAPYWTSNSSLDLSSTSTTAGLHIVGFVQDGTVPGLTTAPYANLLVTVMEPQIDTGVVSVAT